MTKPDENTPTAPAVGSPLDGTVGRLVNDTDGLRGSVTMAEMYGDGSEHEGCQECGLCRHCGDCKCSPA